ncbi:MAG TPA: caspase family protein [Pyrinomonadaceae bacterium]
MSEFNRNLAIVIGIDEYENGIPKLRTANRDAKALSRILKKRHGYDVIFRADHEATLPGLKRLIEEELPLMVQPDDRVLFYFAGHGVATDSDDGPAGYILPQDARPENDRTFLQMTDLHRSLSALQCRHLLVILDCCFAGAFRWSSVRHFRPLSQVIHREQYDYFIKDPAWQVITSSAYDQTAQDKRNEKDKHSPFASALLRGLLGKADVFPPSEHKGDTGDGVITATELYLYLRWSVEGPADKGVLAHRQTPSLWPFSSKHGKGEYIFLVPKRTPQLPPAPPLNEENNPYRGLMPYDERHKELFFGREKVKAALNQKVASAPMTVVVGASGTGKSSLVKAGLLPSLRLRTDEHWQLLSPLRPGRAPLQALVTLLSTDGEPTAPYCSPTKEAQADSILTDVVEAWRKNNPEAKLLLVVDQLEELVTMCRNNDERERFLRALDQCLDRHAGHFHLVLTLRSDFEPQFSSSALKPRWNNSRFIIPPMTQDELREAIEGPASARVLYFESQELVNRLINEVVLMPGALPLLSFTLSEMYFKYLERRSADRALTEEDYDALGGIVGSLRRRANREYEGLEDAALKATMRRAMLRMVSLEGGEIARRRVALSELTYTDENENRRVALVMERLIGARLIVKDVDGEGVEYVEPAHDALVRGWDKLWQWIQEEQREQDNLLLRRRLTEAANDWEKGARKTGQLWDDDPRLPQLSHMLEGHQYWFSALEGQFIEGSIKQKKGRRRKRNAWVTAAFVILAATTIVAFYQAVQASAAKNVAEEKSKEAEMERGKAVAAFEDANRQKVIAEGERDKAKRALIAEQIAIEETKKERDRANQERDRALVAENTARREQARAEEQTRIAQEQTRIAKSELARSLYTQSQVESEELANPSKALVLAAQAAEAAPPIDNRLDVYKFRAVQLSENAPRFIMPLPTGLLQEATLSTTGDRLLALYDDARMKVWNARDGGSYPVPQELDDLSAAVSSSSVKAAFSPDNSLTAVIVASSKLRHRELWVWKTASSETVLRVPLPGVNTFKYNLSFSPDGTSVVFDTYSPDRKLWVWNMEAKTPPTEPSLLPTNFDFYSPMSSNPSRNWTVIGSLNAATKEYETRVVEITTGRAVCSTDCAMRHAGPIKSARLSSDAQWLATVSFNEGLKKYELRLWNAQTGQQVSVPGLYGDEEVSVADISRDGKKILTKGEGGIQVWRPLEQTSFASLPIDRPEHTAFSTDATMVVAVTEISRPSPQSHGREEKPYKYEIKTWDIQAMAQIDKSMRVINDTLPIVSFDGTVMTTVTNAGKIIGWNLIRNNQPLSIPLRNVKDINKTVFSPDGTRLLTITYEEKPGVGKIPQLRLWDVGTGEMVWSNPDPLPPGEIDDDEVAFSMNGERLLAFMDDESRASGGEASSLHVWNIKGRRPAKSLTVEGSIVGAAFRESTGQVVIFKSSLSSYKESTESVLQLCDIEAEKCGNVERKQAYLGGAFSLDGEHFYVFTDKQIVIGGVAGSGRDIIVPYAAFIDFDTFTFKSLPKKFTLLMYLFQKVRGIRPLGANSFSFSLGPPTGKHYAKIVAEFSNTTFYLRNTETGLPLSVPKIFDAETEPITFSPDGKWVATVQNGSNVRVWEAATGMPISQVMWHKDTVGSLCFTADGKHLFTVTDGGIVRRWSFAAGGTERFDWLQGMGEAVTGIRFTPDGFEYMLPADYLRRKNSFMEKLRVAAMSDERACFLLRQYEPTQCVTQR